MFLLQLVPVFSVVQMHLTGVAEIFSSNGTFVVAGGRFLVTTTLVSEVSLQIAWIGSRRTTR